MLADNEVKETKPMEDNSSSLNQVDQPMTKCRRRYYRWFLVALYAVLVLSGQTVATLLGRLYYEKHGKSKWMGTLVQTVGFPILLPYFCISSAPKNPTNNNIHSKPSASMLAFVYVTLGIFEALSCYLDSLGLAYLPVSTYSLITSSRLAFNAFFSFFLNSMRFTPYIINSLVLLTLSSTLLVFQPDSEHNSTGNTRTNYVLGFIASVAASASYGLFLSLTQLAFVKVLKRNTVRVLIDVIVYESLVATCVTLVGLFASGEWNELQKEMEEYQMGKASYLLTLTFTAINWQLYNIGCVGLIFEVSSLFSNAIIALEVPIVSILAVFIFHDKMQGIKAISLVLAIWGFISYLYQYYLDDRESYTENRNTGHILKASTFEEINS